MRFVRVFLDSSLEISIAVFRASALISAVALPAVVLAGIWAVAAAGESWGPWLATVAAVVLFGAGFGVLGFYVFGNEEWRRGKTADHGASVRND